MTVLRPLRATYLPAAEFEALFGPDNSVRNEARRLIDEAQKAAAALREAVARENAAIDRRLTEISEAELEAFLDTKRIAHEAEAFVALLDAAAEVTRGFGDLRPWLVRLVETAVTRIVGTLDDADLVGRLVAEGLGEIDPGETTTLRAAPDCLPRIAEARRAYPDRFAAVRSIAADPALDAGRMLLETSRGFVEVTLAAQIDAVMAQLSADEADR